MTPERLAMWSRRGFYLALAAFIVASALRAPDAVLWIISAGFLLSFGGWMMSRYLGVQRRLAANRLERYVLGRVCPECGYNIKATPGRCPECGFGTGAAKSDA